MPLYFMRHPGNVLPPRERVFAQPFPQPFQKANFMFQNILGIRNAHDLFNGKRPEKYRPHHNAEVFNKNKKPLIPNDPKPQQNNKNLADLPEQIKNGFVKKAGVSILYKDGKPHTGLGKNADDTKLLLYKEGKPYYELAPSYDKLYIKQGATGDCYLLATLIGIFSNPDTHACINKMCTVSSNSELVISFKPNFSKMDSAVETQFSKIFNSKSNLDYLKNKGYSINFDKKDKEITITVTQEKLLSIVKEQKGKSTNLHSGAKTNSLFVMVMEHLVGNMLMLIKGQVNPENQASLIAHNNRGGEVDLYSLISNLFNYKSGNKKPHHARIRPTDTDTLLKHCEYFDINKVGAAHKNKNGFVVVSYNYGKKDQYGAVHSRHALTLNQLIHDNTGKIIAMELINPWGNKETLQINKAISKNIALMFYVPEGVGAL